MLNSLSDQSIKTGFLLLAGTAIVLLLMTAILMLMRLAARPRWVLMDENTGNLGGISTRMTAPGNGLFCGKCGRILTGDPIKAIVLADENYLVYRCKTCSSETILTEK